eukprot:gene9490-12785_t
MMNHSSGVQTRQRSDGNSTKNNNSGHVQRQSTQQQNTNIRNGNGNNINNSSGRVLAAPFQTSSNNRNKSPHQNTSNSNNNSISQAVTPRTNGASAKRKQQVIESETSYVDYRNFKFKPLDPLPSIKFAKYCGPTPESNWVIPGVLLVGAYPASQDDVETFELITAILKLGIRKFVCLQLEYQMGVAENLWRNGQALRPYFEDVKKIIRNKAIIPEFKNCDIADEQDISFDHCPIEDCGITVDGRVLELCKKLVREISEGEIMYIHCWGGHGRTGTVVSIMLHLMYGLTAIEAMRRCQVVHDLRHCPVEVGSPQTQTQRDQVIRIVNGLIQRYRSEKAHSMIQQIMNPNSINTNTAVNEVNLSPPPATVLTVLTNNAVMNNSNYDMSRNNMNRSSNSIPLNSASNELNDQYIDESSEYDAISNNNNNNVEIFDPKNNNDYISNQSLSAQSLDKSFSKQQLVDNNTISHSIVHNQITTSIDLIDYNNANVSPSDGIQVTDNIISNNEETVIIPAQLSRQSTPNTQLPQLVHNNSHNKESNNVSRTSSRSNSNTSLTLQPMKPNTPRSSINIRPTVQSRERERQLSTTNLFPINTSVTNNNVADNIVELFENNSNNINNSNELVANEEYNNMNHINSLVLPRTDSVSTAGSRQSRPPSQLNLLQPLQSTYNNNIINSMNEVLPELSNTSSQLKLIIEANALKNNNNEHNNDNNNNDNNSNININNNHINNDDNNIIINNSLPVINTPVDYSLSLSRTSSNKSNNYIRNDSISLPSDSNNHNIEINKSYDENDDIYRPAESIATPTNNNNNYNNNNNNNNKFFGESTLRSALSAARLVLMQDNTIVSSSVSVNERNHNTDNIIGSSRSNLALPPRGTPSTTQLQQHSSNSSTMLLLHNRTNNNSNSNNNSRTASRVNSRSVLSSRNNLNIVPTPPLERSPSYKSPFSNRNITQG